MAKIEEIWKDVAGYSRYQVSSLGRVKSLSKIVPHNIAGFFSKKSEKILKPIISPYGYYEVHLYGDNGSQKNYRVNRLVAHAFIGDSNEYVNHKNGIKTDNRVENLEFISHRDNLNHAKLGVNSNRYSSKYPGVSWCSNRKKWIAVININRKKIFLGSYLNEIEANEAYRNSLKQNGIVSVYN